MVVWKHIYTVQTVNIYRHRCAITNMLRYGKKIISLVYNVQYSICDSYRRLLCFYTLAFKQFKQQMKHFTVSTSNI